MPIAEFRRECREFAEHWIDVQRTEFKRLGVVGDWDHPYTTMAYQAEAGIFRELAKFLLSGELYRGKKSVMWSVVEKTALAEAEVEYRDHTSTTIIVRFPVAEAPRPELAGASVLIWTTTPWTIPGNRAVAYGEDVDYRVIEVTEVAERLARPHRREAGAGRARCSRAWPQQAKITGYRTLADLPGRALAGTILQHPLHGRATTSRCPCSRPISSAPRKARASCTSRPRTAPTTSSSGRSTASRCRMRSAEDGHYADDVPLFAGVHVFKAAEPVIEALRERRRAARRAASWCTAIRIPGAPRRR